MEEQFDKNYQKREEVFSKAVKAGKRTYFFDVKTTKGNDYFLTITESKKRMKNDGTFIYEKHKIFLYKEDFEKFTDGLNESLTYIKNVLPNAPVAATENGSTETSAPSNYADVSFEDLGNK